MKRELYNEIENYMKSCVKETAHDREHIYRVLGNCIKIAENETNVDYDILLAAALLHDIGRDGKKKNHNEIGAEMAEKFLKTIDFPQEKVVTVCDAIRTHNNESYGKQETIEAKILYDADKLDAVGIMGISRSLMGVGNYNHPMYVIKNGRIDTNEDCETDTFVRYYVRTLAKNYDRFFTETAKRIADEQKGIDDRFYKALLNLVNENCAELDKVENLLEREIENQ